MLPTTIGATTLRSQKPTSVLPSTSLPSNQVQDPSVATVSISAKLVCRQKSLQPFPIVGKNAG